MVEILGTDIEEGDIVEIDWADHYAYEGKRPGEIVVRTWGKVDEITEEGIALVLNEVQGELTQGTKPKVDRVIDGQLILRPVIKNIEVLRKLLQEDKLP